LIYLAVILSLHREQLLRVGRLLRARATVHRPAGNLAEAGMAAD
jgi:hypothetical protein